MKTFFQNLPKVELHIHLEGAIPLPCLWDIIKQHDCDINSLKELEQKFEYENFPHFLEIWTWKNSFLKNVSDIEYMAEMVGRDLVGQNICYSEFHISPADFEEFGIDSSSYITAINSGLSKVNELEYGLIVDIIRNYKPELGMERLDQVLELNHEKVLGVGLGGAEHKVPPEYFEDVYAKARKHGLKTTAHAGEAVGPESVWGALKALNVDRVGHGLTAKADSELVDHLLESQIHIEMCPISNVRTGSIDTLANHPIADFLRKGLNVSVNTDDPKMFHTSLVQEFSALHDAFDLTEKEVVQLTRNAIHSSWANAEIKTSLHKRLDDFTGGV